MKIIIGCDHGGFELKEELKKALSQWDIEYEDVGCHGTSSVDYPEYAHLVARSVANGDYDLGLLICGTGIGMAMAANKHRGVRAAMCTDCYSAEMTRAHNNANVLCLGGRVVGAGVAIKILKTFIEVSFEGGRHSRRVEKLEPEQ